VQALLSLCKRCYDKTSEELGGPSREDARRERRYVSVS
jgi:hypothetical protein